MKKQPAPTTFNVYTCEKCKCRIVSKVPRRLCDKCLKVAVVV